LTLSDGPDPSSGEAPIRSARGPETSAVEQLAAAALGPDADGQPQSPLQAHLGTVDEMIGGLVERLNRNPKDTQGWRTLGWSYFNTERFTADTSSLVFATDADVDGMHIRLLLMTFFLQFFPDLVKAGHVYILETPLFRVRNKKETIYCYSEEEKQSAVSKLGSKPEITRFKGLGEISPEEFGTFIGENIRLQPVLMAKETHLVKILEFYMGKNTPDRQDFIIENLRVEMDRVKEEEFKEEEAEAV